MPVSKVDVVILGLLAEESLYGYELLERFRERGMGFWVEVGRASVYQGLRRLEADGLVSGKAEEGTEGPDRRVYRITRSGRERLRAGLRDRFGRLAPYEIDAALALGFVHLLPAGEVRSGIAARERAIRDLLDAIAGERVGRPPGHGRGGAVARRMLDLQEALAEADLAWLAAFRRAAGRLHR